MELEEIQEAQPKKKTPNDVVLKRTGVFRQQSSKGILLQASVTLDHSVILNESNQCIPTWSGFISETGTPPTRLYYPVINHPITEYKSIKEYLGIAKEVTHEVNQEYIITIFDMDVCMKAYPHIWNDSEWYKKHVVLIGTFCLACAYMKAIGKKIAGFSLSEVFVEAGLVGPGSLSGVMLGKNYDAALYCHTIL